MKHKIQNRWSSTELAKGAQGERSPPWNDLLIFLLFNPLKGSLLVFWGTSQRVAAMRTVWTIVLPDICFINSTFHNKTSPLTCMAGRFELSRASPRGVDFDLPDPPLYPNATLPPLASFHVVFCIPRP